MSKWKSPQMVKTQNSGTVAFQGRPPGWRLGALCPVCSNVLHSPRPPQRSEAGQQHPCQDSSSVLTQKGETETGYLTQNEAAE